MSQEERAEELASELEEANDLLRDARTQCAHFAQRAEQAERALADKDQQIAMLKTLLHEARTQLHAAEEANESLRQECGRLQYEYDNAKDAQGQRDWLERRLQEAQGAVHAAQEALQKIEALGHIDGPSLELMNEMWKVADAALRSWLTAE